MKPQLNQHYNRLIFGGAAPLILVIVSLGVVQFLDQRAHELDNLRQTLAGQRIALNRVVKVVLDHVQALHLQAEDTLAASTLPAEPALAASLYPLMRLAHRVTPYLERSYYQSAEGGWTTLYPPTAPTGLPDGQADWSVPQATKAGLRIVHTAAVQQAKRQVGTVGVEIRLDFLSDFLHDMAPALGELWLFDADGRLLADSTGQTQAAQQVLTTTTALPAALHTLTLPALAASGDFQAQTGYQVLALPLATAPWTLVYAVPTQHLNAALLPRLLPYAVILAGLVLTLLLTQLVLRRQFVAPALALVDYLSAESRQQQPTPPRLPRLWQPWLELVSTTFRDNRAYLYRLQDSEALKAAIIDAALDAVVTLDAAGRIAGFNPAAERIFHCGREAALGRAFAELLGTCRPGSLREELAALAPATLGRRLEIQARRSDGSEFAAELSLNAVHLAERRLYTAFIRDLTLQKRAESELARQRETLYQREKLSALGSLLAGVAHELNNPLSVVVGRAIMLEEETTHPATASGVRKIREAAERCTRIVKTFIAMARQRAPTRAPVALNEVITAAADLIGYGLRSHGIELELDLDPDLPTLPGDADQLTQVFINLIVNAQQALADTPGPRRLAIHSGYDAATRRIEVRLCDNGPGVPADLHARIFEPFFTTKSDSLGIGVGLAVSHGIVQSHNGTIQVDNRPDGGACFTVTLPAIPSDRPAPTPTLALPRVPPQSILIVDDEPEIAAMLAEILTRHGHRTAIAHSGKQALELIACQSYDAIVSDLRMPDLDGSGLYQALKVSRPRLAQRVIFITGDALSGAARAFLATTGRPHLEKPFQPDEVVRTVHRVLEAA